MHPGRQPTTCADSDCPQTSPRLAGDNHEQQHAPNRPSKRNTEGAKMTTLDIQTDVHAARKIDAATHHDLWGRVMASRDTQKQLFKPDHRQTLAGLMTVACTDCFCHDCICDDVADMNASVPEDEQGCGCNGAGCYQCKGKGSR